MRLSELWQGTQKGNRMTTKKILEALKPYAPELSWGTIIKKWYVVLWDYDAATFYADDIDGALRLAFDATMKAEAK